MNPKTDNELILLTLKEKDNFASLIERYEKKLSRYIWRLTGLSKECIEDILQESFIKIYKNLNNFDTNLKFSSWAYRITHNEALNYRRKHKNENIVPLETDNNEIGSLIDILADSTNVHKETVQKEVSEKVREALNDLPQKYKEVLILFYLEEKDYTEISDILKKPMGTIATLLNRAKKKFKSLAQNKNLTSLT